MGPMTEGPSLVDRLESFHTAFALPEYELDRLWETAANLLDPPTDLYWNNPNAWAADNLDGWEPAPYQEEVLAALPVYKRVSERGPHGLGKSSMAAVAILWFADTRDQQGVDWKVVTTASVWRQLTYYLWPEVRKWAAKMKYRQFTGKELLQLEIKLRTGRAFAIASDEPENLEGAHADHILYVIDEGKNVPTPTWDAIEGALSSGDSYCLAISTPGKAEGRFYEIQTRRPGTEDWWVKHVTLEEAISAGRISRNWAEQRAKLWGANSQTYINRVLGEFATDDSLTNVIPLTWVEAANERWWSLVDSAGHISPSTRTSWNNMQHRADALCGNLGVLRSVGVDVAYMGDDMTIIAPMYELPDSVYIVSTTKKYSRITTIETSGHIVSILRKAKMLAEERARSGGSRGRQVTAVIDIIGVGTGVVDQVRQHKFDVDAFNGSEGSKKLDRTKELGFINRRSEAWWALREALDPSFGPTLALPPDDELTGDLTAPTWDTTAKGKVQIERKDQIRARLGRSPDKGDAVTMAYSVRTVRAAASDFRFVSFPKVSVWSIGR